MKRFVVSLIIVVLFTYLSSAESVTVDRVYFESETIWAVNDPRVMCDITEDGDEIVEEVQWHRFDQLVYRWAIDERIQVYGVLEDNVDIPTNDTDWNIKINRLKKYMEGNFTCTAITNTSTTSTSQLFNFIVFYSENKTSQGHTDEKLCHAAGFFNYTSVYPKPLAMICEMKYQSLFKLRLNGTETASMNEDGSFQYYYQVLPVHYTQYMEGSEMTCFSYVYGEAVTHFKWKPMEAPNCLALQSFSGYTIDLSKAVPGCRGGYKSKSRITFICKTDSGRNKEIGCDANGNWTDLSGSQWRECPSRARRNANTAIAWIFALTSSFLYLQIF